MCKDANVVFVCKKQSLSLLPVTIKCCSSSSQELLTGAIRFVAGDLEVIVWPQPAQ